MADARNLATFAVARNVLHLMETGVVWPDAHLETHPGLVTIDPPNPWMMRQPDIDRHAIVFADVAREFPGGKLEISRHRASGGKQGRPLVDRAEYKVMVLDVLVRLAFYVPHEHESYKGHVSTKDGTPEWRCTGCNQRITITQARALGLLPPRGN